MPVTVRYLAFASANRHPRRRALIAILALMATHGAAAVAMAAVPTTALIEGALLSTGGSPAADGDYDVTFSVYATEADGNAAWTEGPVQLKIVGGRFTHALGSAKALDAKALEALAAQWLAVKVGSDPELPRKKIHSAVFALHAASASAVTCSGCIGADNIANGSIAAAKLGFNYAGSSTKGGPAVDLECTGCVSVAELKFDGDLDLGGNSLKAQNATFGGNVAAKTITAVAFVGDGSKLTGIALPSGACPPGEAVTGIAADGKLLCKAVAAPLPVDGLDEVSNGMMTTQFVDSVATAAGIAIPDNTGSNAVAKVTLPDLGNSQGVTIQVDVASTDLSALSLKLLPPDDKKVGVVLCDPCGVKDAKALSTSFPDKTKPKGGDLGVYVGANVAGDWTLIATDTSFCVKQAPGNAELCDLTNKLDGQIKSFAVTSKTLSSTKVAAQGLLQLQLAAKAPQPCGPTYIGSLYFDTSVASVRYCDGKSWRNLADTCGNGVIELSEECDDGNNQAGDGCSAACKADYGYAAANPAKSCQDLLTVATGAGAPPKDGAYWLDTDGPGGAAAFQALCDMTQDGGGWTLALKSLQSNSDWHFGSALWTNTDLLNPTDFALANGKNAKYPAFHALAATSLRVRLGDVTKVFTLSNATKGKTLQALTAQGLNTTAGTNEAIEGKEYKPTSYWGLTANGHEAFICSKLSFVYDTYATAGTVARIGYGISQEFPCGHNGTAEGFGLLDRGSDGDNLGSGRLQWNAEQNFFAAGWVWVK